MTTTSYSPRAARCSPSRPRPHLRPCPVSVSTPVAQQHKHIAQHIYPAKQHLPHIVLAFPDRPVLVLVHVPSLPNPTRARPELPLTFWCLSSPFCSSRSPQRGARPQPALPRALFPEPTLPLPIQLP